MNEQFSVFDEWGNKVGKFIPTGGGLGDTVIMIFVLILAWVFGFVIYLFIKLIIKGFEAISDERWDEAVAYLALPGLLVIFFIVSMVGGTIVSANKKQLREQVQSTQIAIATETAIAEETAKIEATQTAESDIQRAQGVIRLENVHIVQMNGWLESDRVQWTLVNGWDQPIRVSCGFYYEVGQSNAQVGDWTLEAGNRRTLEEYMYDVKPEMCIKILLLQYNRFEFELCPLDYLGE